MHDTHPRLSPIMKPLPASLAAFLLILPAGAIRAQAPAPPAQTDGFLDVPWSSPAEVVKKDFASRSRARLDRAASTDEELQFNGGRFAGFKVERFILKFSGDRFWKADVIFEPARRDYVKEFQTLRQLLVGKYGAPGSDSRRAEDQSAEWYLRGVPGVDKDKIFLTTEAGKNRMTMFYAADRIAKEPAAAPPRPPDPGKTKTLRTAPGAKDDL